MSYTALYRKFRPETFEDVKGQDAIVTTLKNQINADRIGHAYLFCGTRGTGKTSVAKVFAKAVNCEHPVDGSPCGKCDMCKEIASGASMNVIEIDAASNNGVDNIREIREEVEYRPTRGKYKVYIIDEVHMLSIGAFNALLKTLEEPPSYVIFILATTEMHKIPVTILSRCQRYDFKRITVETLMERMRELMEQEHVQVEDKALRYIAKAADGAMRDALSLLDQCIAFHMGETLTYERVLDVLGAADTEVFGKLLDKIVASDVAGTINVLEDMIVQGKEIGQFITDFTWYLRNLLLVKTSDDPSEAVDASAEQLAEWKERSERVDMDVLMRYIRVLSQLSGDMRFASQKRVSAEIGLIKLCRPQMEVEQDAMLDRMRQLESRLEELEQAPPVRTVSHAFRVEDDIVEEAPVEKPAVAAPEDLQRIKSDWLMLVGQTSPRLKQTLQTAIPKYDGNTGENKLYVEFPNYLAQPYIEGPDGRKELENIIARQYNKSVEVEMYIKSEGKSQGIADITVEEQIKDTIHMDVVEEE